MKQFIKYVVLFSLPFIAIFIAITLAPYSKKYGYHLRKNVDCNTSWIYYRLFENPAPVDVAFLGSSHTGCSINDSLIERRLKSKHGRTLKTTNLSYCTNGRNIQYPLLNDILKTKKPKLVVIEVMEIESKKSHQDFAYIADYKTVLNSFSNYNFYYFSEVTDLVKSRFSFLRDQYVYKIEINPPTNYKIDYVYVPFKFYADSNDLAEHKAYKMKKLAKGVSSLTQHKLQYPKEYIIKMANRLNEEQISFVFLYIPPYGLEIEKPLHYDFLTEHGKVWLPPSSIFENPKHWVDGEHLNYEGSSALSNWLVDEIDRHLSQ